MASSNRSWGGGPKPPAASTWWRRGGACARGKPRRPENRGRRAQPRVTSRVIYVRSLKRVSSVRDYIPVPAASRGGPLNSRSCVRIAGTVVPTQECAVLERKQSAQVLRLARRATHVAVSTRNESTHVRKLKSEAVVLMRPCAESCDSGVGRVRTDGLGLCRSGPVSDRKHMSRRANGRRGRVLRGLAVLLEDGQAGAVLGQGEATPATASRACRHPPLHPLQRAAENGAACMRAAAFSVNGAMQGPVMCC